MTVLIATPTHEAHREFLPMFLASVRSQTLHCDVLFANTSADTAFAAFLHKECPATLTIPKKATKQERVIAARQALIDHFLKGSWTHLFFVDSDVFIPAHAAATLQGDGKPIVAGVCLSPLRVGGKIMILPVAFDRADNEEYRQPLTVASVLAPKVSQKHSVGFGCCMIERAVLERTRLRTYEEGNTAEDILFCVDAGKQGFSSYLDTRVWADHHGWPLGDARNQYLTREWNLSTSTPRK